MTDIPDNVLDEVEAPLRNAAFVLSGFDLSCSDERDAHSALAKLRDARKAEPSPTIKTPQKFIDGQRVRKIKGSSWHGRVVGFYSTELTPVGIAVESEREPGSVQVYPEAALESWEGDAPGLARKALLDRLARFESCASKIVGDDYATGYREAIEHALDILEPLDRTASAMPVEATAINRESEVMHHSGDELRSRPVSAEEPHNTTPRSYEAGAVMSAETMQGPFLVERKDEPGVWSVEQFGGDGECYVTNFYGPDSHDRASAYHRSRGSMSAETMREAAANVADKCAEQNKAAAIKLRKRQHSETDTWNSNELDDTAAEAKAIAVMIRALPLTAPKEG